MSVDFPVIPAVDVFVGRIGSGKTSALLERADELVAQGVAPADIVLFCATPSGAFSCRRVLRERDLSDVRVTTPREWALRLLGMEDVRAFTGRCARMLMPHEEAFLFEDMRVTGMKEKRIKEMTRFFARMWTELADDDPHWLLEGEETFMHEHLKNCLAFLGGLLEPEIGNYAVRYLLHAGEVERWRAKHVLVDDFGLMSRASQLMCCLLAERSATLTLDPFMKDRVFDSFPYGAGVDELVARNPHACIEQLQAADRPKDIVVALRALEGAPARGSIVDAQAREYAEPSLKPVCSVAAKVRFEQREDAGFEQDSGEGASGWDALVAHACNAGVLSDRSALEMRGFPCVGDELSLAAKLASDALSKGTSPEDIVVVSFKRPFISRVGAALSVEGIPWSSFPDSRALRGDVRELRSCAVARQCTLLVLAADSRNASAWRAMCGFGDSLGRSLAFREFREYAQENGLALVDVLEACLAGGVDVSVEARHCAEQVLEVYKQVRPLAQRIATLRGESALDAVSLAVTGGVDNADAARFRSLVGFAREADDVWVLAGRLLAHLSAPSAEAAEELKPGVRVVLPNELVGLKPQVIIATGFVDGFIPPRRYFDVTASTQEEAETLWIDGMRTLYVLVGSARKHCVLTYFTRMDPQEAQDLDVKVSRVRFENGRRVCVCEPSIYSEVLFCS